MTEPVESQQDEAPADQTNEDPDEVARAEAEAVEAAAAEAARLEAEKVEAERLAAEAEREARIHAEQADEDDEYDEPNFAVLSQKNYDNPFGVPLDEGEEITAQREYDDHTIVVTSFGRKVKISEDQIEVLTGAPLDVAMPAAPVYRKPSNEDDLA